MPPKKPRAKPKSPASLGKQQEAALMRVYNAYFSNYIKGDIKAVALLLDEDYTQVGSAEAEVFFNKKDAVKFLHDTIDQVAGKAELRNRVIRVEDQKEFVLITELTDLFVLIENEWTFHSKFRASSLMRKRKGGWRFYHQHSSFPDIRAEAGENISIEKVALENLQLRDAVKRRTVDLEQKTRDLEVEAALERVRARAMSMRISSELEETSAVLFHQINNLGIDAIRTGVGIFDDPNNAMELWLTTVSESKEVVRILDYVNLNVHPVFENIIPARKEKKPYALTVLKGNEVKQYYNMMSTYLSLPKQHSYNKEEFFYSFFFSDGAINVITAQSLTEEECGIMSRLVSVFGVIYTRFQDLEKAEAQAREARIEASLERIRSKALAMHQSNDLAGVVDALYSELSALDFGIHQILLSIYDIDNHVIEWWSRGYTEGHLPQRNLIPIIDHPFSNLLLEQWRSGADSWAYNLEGDIKRTWDEYLFTKTDLQHFPKEVKEIMRGLKSVWLSDAFMKHGSLQAAGPTPLPEDKVQVLKRFARVVDLAYTRMVDLQKAEAQTREAQIEATLERVRAGAMAMHRSEDVGSAMLLMFDQLTHLGIRAERCGICIPMDSNTMEFWTATPNESGEPVRVVGQESFDLHIALRNAYQAWKEKKEHQTYSFQGEDLVEYYRAVKETMPVLEWREKMHGAEGGQEYLETFPFADGWLYTFTSKELSEDGIQVLVRFAKVFGLTYRRYLDLQVAEAQAREAQIEAALERVRSRSMAMHKSEELREVIQRVFEQLVQLGFNIDSATFDMKYGEGLDFDLWTAVPGQLYSTRQYVPSFDNAWFNKKKQAKEDGLDFFTVSLTVEEKNAFYRHFFEHIKNVPEERQKYIFDCPGLASSTTIMGNISLIANNYAGISYSEEENAILRRFGVVLEQSYTRFLDLQKAEAQAREAQVQLALERVRARTMAMQSSDELAEVSYLLNKQVVELGIPTRGCAFNIYNEHDSTEWFSNLEGTLPTYKTPRENIFLKYYEAGQRGETLWVEEFGGDRIKAHYEYLFSVNILGIGPEHAHKVNESIPDYQIDHVAYFKYGYLLFITLVPAPEAHEVFKRFAREFEQTYTRFLDLQKAEAQAREAQVETSLERVRSRMMAMHQSEDLPEVMKVITEQFTHLGFDIHAASFLPDITDTDLHCWISTPQKTFPVETFIPYFDNVIFNRIREVVDSKLDSLVLNVSEDDTRSWWNNFLTKSNVSHLSEKGRSIVLSISVMSISMAVMKYTLLSIWNYHGKPFSEEENAILERFAKVSEQTYTRYLELKKAEAQAREAEVQLSLERVRARAMAMHHSDELKEVAGVMREQFSLLGQQQLETMAIHIYPEEGDTFTSWFAIRPPDNPGKVETHATAFSKTSTELAREMLSRYQSKAGEYIVHAKGQAMKEWLEMILNTLPSLKELWGNNVPAEQYWYFSDFSAGSFLLIPREEPSNESKDLLKRAASVFDLAYRRYLDLKKAEDQAREAQIEAALERVRASMMAMHQSDVLPDVIKVVAEQFVHLGMRMDTVLFFPPQQRDDLIFWTATTERTYPIQVAVPYGDNPFFPWIHNAIRETIEFSTICLSHEETQHWWNHFIEKSNTGPLITEERKKYILASKGLWCSAASRKNSTLVILSYYGPPFSDEENAILKRFASVFEQAYTRFLDIQKAEAQAREAQIEAVLEKIRAASMAMHKSEELQGAINAIISGLNELAFDVQTAQILIFKDNPKGIEYWTAASSMVKYQEAFWVPGSDIPYTKALHIARENRQNLVSLSYAGVQKDETFLYLFAETDYRNIPLERKQFIMESPAAEIAVAIEVDVGVQAIRYLPKPFSTEEKSILHRLSRVFKQTYTRFLDLQKAEAQAREAQIEASLERVRSSALAMQKPSDMLDVCHIISDQLQLLNIKDLRNVQTLVINAGKNEYVNYQYFTIYDKTSVEVIDYRLHPVELALAEQMLASPEAFYSKTFEGDELQKWRDHRRKTNQLPDPKLDEALSAYYYFFSIGAGALGVTAFSPLDENALTTFKRFRNVFELAYKRYIDIEQANFQAKEAKVEAALERVRGKAMAMHNSDDLAATAGTVLSELKKLEINPLRFAIGLVDKTSRKAQSYSFRTSSEGDTLALVGILTLSGNPVLEKAYTSWETGTDYFPELYGETYKSYYEAIAPALSLPPVSEAELKQKHFGSFIPIPVGYVVAWTQEPFNEIEVRILKRFASIIDLTFRRYVELQKAEASALEAVRSASLDRVRAEIASMRSTNDLSRITPLIWSELTTLGVPFVRCGLFIMDDEKKLVYNYLSTPDGKPISSADGKSIAVIQFPFDTPGFFEKILGHWQERKIYIDHLDKAAFAGIATTMVQYGAFASEEQYLSTLTHTDLDAHFLPFLQGMLYVANTTPLDADQLKLVQSLADAFSTAYARYEDFNKLESAKAQVENALTDLKQTQTQLVQSEKMASLGELTAGIAHEIQNPLNFVNNFSEVSGELLDEMVAEVKKGNLKDIQTLVSDIKQNLDKIHFHGKRADGIVKSMLQHSRKSTNQKEPTDINALCDEYLRLSYHGLRAKDKSFNAKFETELDPNVGKLNVLPQEIGRVILNLINNAFYAVSEKKSAFAKATADKETKTTYEPTVIVSTKKENGKVLIAVKDNGIGIPRKVLDKIFNPFFTTKPTGQGTGLGLSLSYDIITKGHGGELNVVTKEGEGSEFIVQLPAV